MGMQVAALPSHRPLPLSQAGKSPEAPKQAYDPQNFVDAWEASRQEPPHLRGVVYRQSADGSVEVLKYSGQTTDSLPPDIPESAVKDGRVVIYVDGIHQDWGEQQRQIRHFLHGRSEVGADVGQDVIGIHEGSGPSGFKDGVRIAKVLSMLKLVQTGMVPLQWAQKKVYTIDPAVKSVHDQLKQSLLADRKVQLMTHSGGGAETAMALTLLKKQGFGEKIAENVRLLSLASAASLKDFTRAGVKAENIYYTGSKRDPVHYMFRHFIHPFAPLSTALFAANAARYLWGLATSSDPNGLAVHSPDYIFAHNHPRIQSFLDGGPGGVHRLP